MDSFRELYEQLIEQSQNDCLRIIEYDTCPSDKSVILEKFNIGFDVICRFKNSDDSKTEKQSEANRSDFGGYNFYYKIQNEAKAIIVIKKIIYKDSENYNDLWKYLSLIHELGHVDDFKKKKFINCDRLTTDHLNSEIFAEIYVLNFLKNSNDQLNVLARSQYCKRLLEWNTTRDPFQFKISQSVINQFSRKKLEKWSKA